MSHDDAFRTPEDRALSARLKAAAPIVPAAGVGLRDRIAALADDRSTRRRLPAWVAPSVAWGSAVAASLVLFFAASPRPWILSSVSSPPAAASEESFVLEAFAMPVHDWTLFDDD
jgi:hypothetical protein